MDPSSHEKASAGDGAPARTRGEHADASEAGTLITKDSKERHLIRAAVVGLLAGLLAVGFRWALLESEHSRLALIEQLRTLPRASLWAWMVLPAIGMVSGSAVGWCVVKYAPDSAGSGIPHLKGVLLHVRTMRWKRLIPVKFIGGVIGIGAGLSLGREGPTVQMGAAVARAVADVLKVPERAVPQLLSCGAGAGLAAAFNAPLAGFLFVLEELHREMSARTFAGALVATIVADIVARALGGNVASFAIHPYPAIPLEALPVAAFIGFVVGAMGVVFNRALMVSSAAAIKTKAVPRWIMPGIACAICGLVAWWQPEAVGSGHSTTENLLNGQLQLGLWMLGLLLVVKFALTVVSYASGAPGGIFAPMLLLGTISGAIVSKGVTGMFPSLEPHATAFAILGMAAFFTGSVRVPLTGIVLIVEMTGNYQQLLALGIVCLIADLTAGALKESPIYESLLEADLRRREPTKGKPSSIHEARAVYIGVQRGSAMEGRTVRDCGLPRGCLVIAVERSGRELLPEAGLILHPGDHLSVLVPDDEPENAMKIVRLATGL